MRNGIFNNLLPVVLCICVLSAVVSAQGDANDPWDPAEHFRPFWDSVTLSAQIYNPARRPDEDPNGQRRLSIQGVVEMIDYGDLVGVSRAGRGIVALDQDGAEIYRKDGGFTSRSYQAAEDARRLTGFNQRLDEFSFSMSIPMDADQGRPSSVSRLEWSIDTLIASAFEVVDVPFEPNENWIELVPGLEILVEEAAIEGDKYTYKIQAIYDPTLMPCGITGRSWHFQADEVPPATLLVETDVLNTAGQSISDLNPSGDFDSSTILHSSDDGLMHATIRGHGSCSNCGEATTIRYTFALEPYELEARFVLEDIPVPSF